MKLEVWHLLIALVALLAPGIMNLGALREFKRTAEAAQDRTDTWISAVDAESKERDRAVEARLTAAFDRLGDRLEDALRNAYRYCPLGKKEKGD